ncbi:MAG TPA: hypothetical protein VK983_00885 [Candidatus Limnocylindrales bacterium]|nr:hypothetical protein [Candidatus Limnocylindrales bacterium]
MNPVDKMLIRQALLCARLLRQLYRNRSQHWPSTTADPTNRHVLAHEHSYPNANGSICQQHHAGA